MLYNHFCICAVNCRLSSTIIFAACHRCSDRYSSQYSSKGNMLSTPLPALSASVYPSSSLPMAWGNSWLSECSSPFVSTHWLALRSPKAEQHGVPAASFLLVLLKKKKSLREKWGEEIVRWLHHNLSRYVSSLPACLSSCNENQWGLTDFPHAFLSNRVQSFPLFAEPCPLPPNCPAVSYHPLHFYLLSRLHSSTVCSADTRLHTEPQ